MLFRSDFQKGAIEPITRGTYLVTKFGNCYQHFEDSPEEYVTCKTAFLPDGRIFVLHNNGKSSIYDSNGSPVWEGEMHYKGFPAQNIAVDRRYLWASFSEEGAIKRYNLRTMHEELRIGGRESTFVNPQGLWIDGDFLLVCCARSHKIQIVNLKTYTVEDFHTFEEPVWQYIKVNSHEFVLLDSGVYKI